MTTETVPMQPRDRRPPGALVSAGGSPDRQEARPRLGAERRPADRPGVERRLRTGRRLSLPRLPRPPQRPHRPRRLAGRQLRDHRLTLLRPQLRQRLETVHALPRGLRRHPAEAVAGRLQGVGQGLLHAGRQSGLLGRARLRRRWRQLRLGALCPGTFTVNSNRDGRPAAPSPRASTCSTSRRARRSAATVPRSSSPASSARRAAGCHPPWRLKNQTATFFKPEHPTRSAFRVEPFAGAGPA